MTTNTENAQPRSQWEMTSRFVLTGAAAGLALGFIEAGLLFWLPRYSGLLRPDVDFVIWFVAPLVDGLTGALIGFVMGLIAWIAAAARTTVAPRITLDNRGHGAPLTAFPSPPKGRGENQLSNLRPPPPKRRRKNQIRKLRPSPLWGRGEGGEGIFRTNVGRVPTWLAAFGFGLAAAYLGWLLDWFRIGTGILFPRRPGPTLLIECFVIAFVATLLIRLVYGWRHSQGAPRSLFRRLAIANIIIVCALGWGLVFYAIQRPYPHRSARIDPTALQQDSRPNIILVVLDTVRADHLSCYGYPRPTTPNIDAIASHGTLFERAYSSTSWTLASIASIFTGLLPHQHGADWGVPFNAAPWTLARILRSEGYETAGFSSNPFYGLGAWRLSEGFDVYDDDSYSIRHNLAATFIGQSAVEFLYDRLVRYNQFAQRNEGDLNHDIVRWWRHRNTGRPFFLFINPMDAHRPYLPPPPFDRKFGQIPQRLFPRLIAPLDGGRPSGPYTAHERQQMIDGYDNSLAYLDAQLGKLWHTIDPSFIFAARNSHSRPTILIITSDHGEGFGEHGTYDHGWNLYQDVLHVPLIVEGPGIPAGLRIQNVVTNRQLFSTVLDLAMPRKGTVGQASLARLWNPEFAPSENGVVAELGADSSAHQRTASLSFVSSHWHYIDNSNGRRELYNLRTDPDEEHDLANQPDLQPKLEALRAALKARISSSLMPWYGMAYLTPLNQPGATFAQQISQIKSSPAPRLLPIGAAQAYFSQRPPSQVFRPSRSDQDLLRSLPYH